MTPDLSTQHEPITDLFSEAQDPAMQDRFRLSDEQVAFYRENGYLAGVRVLTEAQVDALCDQLAGLFDPNHEGRERWYEYHTNESGDPDNVLFHALGAWRIQPAFHDALWNPAFHPGEPASGRRRAVLARSALLQTGPARRRGGLAPGLFVLEAHHADVPSHLLDRPRRGKDG